MQPDWQVDAAVGAQEEQERHQQIVAALEGKNQDLASANAQLSAELAQTKDHLFHAWVSAPPS